jgi:hypothetical protein
LGTERIISDKLVFDFVTTTFGGGFWDFAGRVSAVFSIVATAKLKDSVAQEDDVIDFCQEHLIFTGFDESSDNLRIIMIVDFHVGLGRHLVIDWVGD